MERGYAARCNGFTLIVVMLTLCMWCITNGGSSVPSNPKECGSNSFDTPGPSINDAQNTSACMNMNDTPSTGDNSTDKQQEANSTDEQQKPNPVAGLRKMALGIRAPYCVSKFCSGSHSRQCFCDMACLLYKDCCYSVIEELIATDSLLEANESGQLSMNIDSHIQSIFPDDIVSIMKSVDCILDNSSGVGKNGYMMVNSCPKMNTTEAIKCTDSKYYGGTTIPVDYETTSGFVITFRNIYCALCNNIKLTQVKFWKVYVSCGMNVAIQNAMSLAEISELCGVAFRSSYTKRHLRSCIDTTKYITYEHGRGDSERDMSTLCDYYIYTIKSKEETEQEGTIYRNPHCAACIQNTTEFVEYSCTDIGGQSGSSGIFPEDGDLNLRVLFDFNQQGEVTSKVSCETSISCTDKEVFDCVSNTCRKLICPFGSEVYKGKCIKANETASKFEVSTPIDDSELTMPPAVVLIEIMLQDITEARNADFITSQLQFSFAQLYQRAGIKLSFDFYYVESKSISSASLIVVVNTENNDVANMAELFQLISGDSNASVYQNVSIRNFENIQLLECENGTLFTDKSAVLDKEYKNRVVLSKHDIGASTADGKWIMKFENEMILDTFVVCLTPVSHPSLNCPMIAYTDNEVYIEGETVFVINTSLTFRSGDYEILKGLIFVCSRVVTKQNALTDIFEYSNHFRIISIATSTFSIVALSVIIAVHTCISELRNMHGLNLSALSLTILIVHVLLLIQSKISGGKACFLFAVILHTVLLCMFVWMNIIGTDMALMFQSKVHINKKNPSTRFKKYIAISLVFPVIIVAFGIGVNFTDLAIRPGYGEMEICWISNSLGMIIFIACPVGVSLILNYGLFAFTVCTIQRARRDTKRVRTQGERAYLLVYFKMTVILGFTWIIALLGPVIRSEAVWLFHIALNGLQGVGLLICFVVNARVIKQMKKKGLKYAESTTKSKRDHSTTISETLTEETATDSIKRKQ